MFTGIIERTGVVAEVRGAAGGKRLCVDCGPMAADCAPGASLAVSGVCLTVAEAAPPVLAFDVITETLARTTLGALAPGGRVNLERSLRPSDRMDGHIVQGHVDGTARVIRVTDSAHEYVIRLRPDAHLGPYIIPKGSIAIDGVSLTIAEVDGGEFTVAIIPMTLERTSLGDLSNGAVVNIESDIIARTVVHWLSRSREGGGLTLAKLQEAGFA